MNHILKIDSGVNSIDLSHLITYVNWHHLNAYFPGEVGENHHKLLAYLSSQLPVDSRVIDLGTQYGASALALSYNPSVRVSTYDLYDYVPFGMKSFRNIPNITGVMGSCFDYIEYFKDANLILLDISPHNGEDERKIMDMLTECGFRGILVLDDINISDEMKNFFASIRLKKIEVTKYGHWSGTGIVVFDDKFIDVEVV